MPLEAVCGQGIAWASKPRIRNIEVGRHLIFPVCAYFGCIVFQSKLALACIDGNTGELMTAVVCPVPDPVSLYRTAEILDNSKTLYASSIGEALMLGMGVAHALSDQVEYLRLAHILGERKLVVDKIIPPTLPECVLYLAEQGAVLDLSGLQLLVNAEVVPYDPKFSSLGVRTPEDDAARQHEVREWAAPYWKDMRYMASRVAVSGLTADSIERALLCVAARVESYGVAPHLLLGCFLMTYLSYLHSSAVTYALPLPSHMTLKLFCEEGDALGAHFLFLRDRGRLEEFDPLSRVERGQSLIPHSDANTELYQAYLVGLTT